MAPLTVLKIKMVSKAALFRVTPTLLYNEKFRFKLMKMTMMTMMMRRKVSS